MVFALRHVFRAEQRPIRRPYRPPEGLRNCYTDPSGLSWKQYGCPLKIVKIIRLLHDDMTDSMTSSRKAWDRDVFLLQFCSTCFSLVWCHTPCTTRVSPYGTVSAARYSTSGAWVNTSRCLHKLKQKGFYFADYCALLDHNNNWCQTDFLRQPKVFGLTIGLGKTEVLYQLACACGRQYHRR